MYVAVYRGLRIFFENTCLLDSAWMMMMDQRNCMWDEVIYSIYISYLFRLK